jgi:hypothetical protein
VEYTLTPFGCRFMGILEEVRRLQEDADSGALSGSGERQDQENQSRGPKTKNY